MQEKVSVNNQSILTESTITSDQNIRALGEQVMRGQIALKKGTKITSAAIGYLSSLGISKINVFKKPTVGIVVTGNELIEPGELLTYGKIYESNGVMLHSTLKNLGYNEISIHKVDDDYQNTLKTLSKVLMEYDVVLISGGISVGDYDFVGKALRELDVDQLFYKVKQKPGKPLFFGKTEKSIVFALPGNPGAALSCFYIYVYKTLQKMSGDIDFSLHRTSARCQTNFTKKGERAQFIKAIYKNGEVTLLDGQSSSMLHTFALANALIYVSESTNSIEINDKVETILLPLN